MARARKLAPSALVRGLVRGDVRAGLSRLEIASDIIARFPNINQNSLSAMIRQEEGRQSRVDAIMALDKRRNVDLRRLVGCRGANSQVRASITVRWIDGQTGAERRYNEVVTLPGQGRAATILNDAIASVVGDARGRGYTPPDIRSVNTSGGSYYRIEYVECT